MGVILLGILALVAAGVAAFLVLTRDEGGGALPDGCTPSDSVCISGPVTVAGDFIEAPFETDLELSEGGTTSVWFFNDENEQTIATVGINRPWVGGSPFTAFTVDTASQAVADQATELCVVVRGADGTIDADTRNCAPIPDEITAG